MNKMLVAVFHSENKAFEGLSALKELHSKGDITLYASAVIGKDVNGEMHLNMAADEGPIGTATGLFTGGLLGLLGGPVGLAIGATVGIMTGLVYDVKVADINDTFIDEVSAAIKRGTTAVIADIEEDWTVPVDSSIERLDGMAFRRLKYEVAEDQATRESEALAAEIKSLKEELAEAKEEDKEAIKAAILKVQNKAMAMHEHIERKLQDSKKHLDAKVETLQVQMKNAKERRKAKIEEHIQKAKTEYTIRSEKLKAASRLITEALALKENYAHANKVGSIA